jgi:hypothetical protein
MLNITNRVKSQYKIFYILVYKNIIKFDILYYTNFIMIGIISNRPSTSI